MKRLKTSVARALEKGQIKDGDRIFIDAEVLKIDDSDKEVCIAVSNRVFWIKYDTQILIPKPEPKQIDFSQEGRVLKSDDTIVKTTGYRVHDMQFSGVVIQSPHYKKGYATNTWDSTEIWQDITDTYQP